MKRRFLKRHVRRYMRLGLMLVKREKGDHARWRWAGRWANGKLTSDDGDGLQPLYAGRIGLRHWVIIDEVNTFTAEQMRNALRVIEANNVPWRCDRCEQLHYIAAPAGYFRLCDCGGRVVRSAPPS